MQTILGAGGVIGRELERALPEYSDRIRLVRRHPAPAQTGQETMVADLTDRKETLEAVKGSEVVYLTAGLPYAVSVWRGAWPRIMRNVIDACAETGAKLVFFDNVYMYGLVEGWMTEETPYQPISKKGEVRAQIAPNASRCHRRRYRQGANRPQRRLLRTRGGGHGGASDGFSESEGRQKGGLAGRRGQASLLYLYSRRGPGYRASGQQRRRLRRGLAPADGYEPPHRPGVHRGGGPPSVGPNRASRC